MAGRTIFCFFVVWAAFISTDAVQASYDFTIESNPNGAQLLINGNPVGTTPYSGSFVFDVTILVELRKHGYSQVKDTISLVRDYTNGFRFTLEKEQIVVLPLTVIGLDDMNAYVFTETVRDAVFDQAGSVVTEEGTEDLLAEVTKQRKFVNPEQVENLGIAMKADEIVFGGVHKKADVHNFYVYRLFPRDSRAPMKTYRTNIPELHMVSMKLEEAIIELYERPIEHRTGQSRMQEIDGELINKLAERAFNVAQAANSKQSWTFICDMFPQTEYARWAQEELGRLKSGRTSDRLARKPASRSAIREPATSENTSHTENNTWKYWMKEKGKGPIIGIVAVIVMVLLMLII